MDLTEFQHIIPLIALLVFGCGAIIGDLFVKHKLNNIAYLVVQIGLIVAMILTARLIPLPMTTALHGLFIDDFTTRILSLFILGSGFTCFWYSRNYVTERGMMFAEYYILGLFSIMGMLVLVAAHSLLTIYLGLELLSLPLYAIVALRRDDGTATEAAIKYFVMGAVASAILLYGMSMFYGATGHLDLAYVANSVNTSAADHQLLLQFGLVFVIVGFGFKLAAAPFHMWAPDVYSGAPTSVTLFLGTAPKLAAFGMVVRLITLAFGGMVSSWQPVLIAMALMSIAGGNLLAIAQTNIKRMLAYSAIAHVGYMLLGFIAGTTEGYSAAMFYMLNYVLMTLAAFGLLTIMSRGSVEVENIDQFNGLGNRNPMIALLWMAVLFSMAGIPPMVGFFAKLFVLKALVSVQLTWVAAVALIFAVWGAFYYIRIIKAMYFDEAEANAPVIRCDFDQQVLATVNVGALLALGIYPTALLKACQMAFSG